jgi:DNA invertase Pin-like site-specific DNA recombinase
MFGQLATKRLPRVSSTKALGHLSPGSSRSALFLLGLQKAGVKFVAGDMPEANETIVGFMAVLAQGERKLISDRTKAALAAAKPGERSWAASKELSRLIAAQLRA